MVILYRKHKDALKIRECDRLYNETLKNCTNLLEEDIHNNYCIGISLNNSVQLNDVVNDVLVFCKKYAFLRGSTEISYIKDPVFTSQNNVVSIDFYLKKIVDF